MQSILASITLNLSKFLLLLFLVTADVQTEEATREVETAAKDQPEQQQQQQQQQQQPQQQQQQQQPQQQQEQQTGGGRTFTFHKLAEGKDPQMERVRTHHCSPSRLFYHQKINILNQSFPTRLCNP